jgi:hypothetical protein
MCEQPHRAAVDQQRASGPRIHERREGNRRKEFVPDLPENASEHEDDLDDDEWENEEEADQPNRIGG